MQNTTHNSWWNTTLNSETRHSILKHNNQFWNTTINSETQQSILKHNTQFWNTTLNIETQHSILKHKNSETQVGVLLPNSDGVAWERVQKVSIRPNVSLIQASLGRSRRHHVIMSRSATCKIYVRKWTQSMPLRFILKIVHFFGYSSPLSPLPVWCSSLWPVFPVAAFLFSAEAPMGKRPSSIFAIGCSHVWNPFP